MFIQVVRIFKDSNVEAKVESTEKLGDYICFVSLLRFIVSRSVIFLVSEHKYKLETKTHIYKPHYPNGYVSISLCNMLQNNLLVCSLFFFFQEH